MWFFRKHFRNPLLLVFYVYIRCKESKSMTSITLKHISEILGLSISTVSRALKDHPDISAKTKIKVKELAETLEYEPNANAINLRMQRNNLFAIILPTISNPFYHSFISKIEEESRKQKFSVMILQSNGSFETEQENLKLCRQNRVTGIFVCLSANTEHLDPYFKIKEYEIPVIFFDKVPDTDEFSCITVADAQAAEMAAQKLLDAGKKNIVALYGNPKLSISERRKRAFDKTVSDSGLQHVKVNSSYATSTPEAATVTEELLTAETDALFCMSDELLMGVMKTVMKKKLQIPAQLSIIAISNGDIPSLYYPEISYIKTSGTDLGELAFSKMLSALAGNQESIKASTNAVFVNGNSI